MRRRSVIIRRIDIFKKFAKKFWRQRLSWILLRYHVNNMLVFLIGIMNPGEYEDLMYLIIDYVIFFTVFALILRVRIDKSISVLIIRHQSSVFFFPDNFIVDEVEISFFLRFRTTEFRNFSDFRVEDWLKYVHRSKIESISFSLFRNSWRRKLETWNLKMFFWMTLPSLRGWAIFFFDVLVVWLKTIFVKVMIFREQKKLK